MITSAVTALRSGKTGAPPRHQGPPHRYDARGVHSRSSFDDISARLRGPTLDFRSLLGLALDVVDTLPPMVVIPLEAFPWMEDLVAAYVAGCMAYHCQPREHRWQTPR